MFGFKTRAQREAEAAAGGTNGAVGALSGRSRQIDAAVDSAVGTPAARGFQPTRAPTPAPNPNATPDNPTGIRFANGGEVRGFRPGKDRGGPVRGPGTGTSDEVPAKVPDGTYIMPADSTQAVGEGQLAAMGARGFKPKAERGGVDVQLSNGEFELPPEQVHAVGVQALDAMKDATHEPVAHARGFKPRAQRPEEPPLFFADGGVVDDERRRPNSFGDAAAVAGNAASTLPAGAARPVGAGPATPGAPTSPTNIFPQSHSNGRSPYVTAPAPPSAPAAAPPDPQVSSDRAAVGRAFDAAKGVSEDAGRAILDVATVVPRGLAGAYDTAVVRPMRAMGVDAAYLSPKLVPDGVDPASMTPFTDQKRMRASAGPDGGAAPVTGAPSPAPAQPAALGFGPTAAGRPASTVTGAAAPDAIAAPADQSSQVASGIYRSGNSYSDTPEGAALGFSSRGGQVSTQNMAAADALEARGMVERAGERAAMDARGFRPAGVGVFADGDADRREARNAAVGSNLGSPNSGALGAVRGLRAERDNRARALEEMRLGVQAQEGGRRDAAALQREQLQQGGANTRTAVQEAGATARAGAGTAIQAGELALRQEAQGFQSRASTRQEALQARYESAKTPEERSAIAQQIRDLSGKAEPGNRFTVVPGGQEWDATAGTMRNVPGRVLNNQTGQFVDQPQGQSPQTAALTNPTTRPVGTISTVNGKSARWDGKAWIPQ